MPELIEIARKFDKKISIFPIHEYWNDIGNPSSLKNEILRAKSIKKLGMEISGLIQARMGSKRLPGKVMLEIQGKPLIGHIFDRLKSINSLKNIILATTKDPKNNELKNYALQQNIKVYQHDIENDIVGRLYNSMKLTKADAILKINADCPLVDPNLLEEGLNIFYRKKSSYDLLTNKISKKFPDGYSYEIISQKVIKWCH